jgi:hypothetical protein
LAVQQQRQNRQPGPDAVGFQHIALAEGGVFLGGHALDFEGQSPQQAESSRADRYLASEQARKSRLQLSFVAVQRDKGRESRGAEYQYY